MEDIAWFKELSKDDIPIVGGKGANLGEMYNAGLPIPPGFAVTSEAFRKFIVGKKIDKQIYEVLSNTNVDNNDELDSASVKVKNIIMNTDMQPELKEEIKEAYENLNVDQDVVRAGGQALDIIKSGREQPFVAVRSSATAEDLPSISKDEHVIVKIGDEIIYDRMKDVYDLYEKNSQKKLYVPSLDGNSIRWIEVKELYKHHAEKTKLVRITTKTGRHITITPNHSLVALTDSFSLKPISVQDVTKDTRIPVVKYLPHEVENKTWVIDLCEVLGDKEIELDRGKIKIKDFKNWKVQNSFPRFIKVDKEFAYFLGLYASEGSIYKSCIDLSCESKKLANKAKKYLKRLGLYTNKNNRNVRLYNRTLACLLHELLRKPLEIKGKGKSARIKKVPNIIFNQNKDIIAQFLKGCFDGDGFVSKESIQITSVSPNLLGGMVKLLELLEIKCYITKRGIEITIPPSEAEKFKSAINFTEKKNKGKLNALIKRYNNRKHNDVLDTIPENKRINSLIEETLKSRLQYKDITIFLCQECGGHLIKNGKHWKQRFICKNCGKTFSDVKVFEKKIIPTYSDCDNLGRFKKGNNPWNKGNRKLLSTYSISRLKRIAKELKNDELDAIANSNVLWDSIRKIEQIPYSGYVYDFVVPKTQNFCAGVGGIITHNTASFAGQQETFLNIRGVSTLLKAVQKCWASLYTPRAIYYRVKNNFPHDKVLIAVVVQKMVRSEKSGVMFSVNPATNNESEIMIETGWGLGEAVVSGSISPDQYIINKENLELKDKIIREQTWMYDLDTNLGQTIKKNIPDYKKKQQKLSDAEIRKLAQLAVKIEGHYGKPQDMEYAIEGSQIYVVQSRPVTTLKKVHKDEVEQSNAEVILTGLGASPGIGIGPVKIVHEMDELGKVKKGDVLVARMTNPDYVTAMERAVAIVTDAGGITCHAAIVGREMGLPVIVGTEKATQVLKEDEVISVNGSLGKVYKGRIKIDEKKEDSMDKEGKVHEVVSDVETVTEIKVIMDLPEFADRAAATGADGVGLLRNNIMLAKHGEHPSYMVRTGKKDKLVQTIVEDVGKIAEAFKGKTVWYRTFDAPTDEYRHMKGGEEEPIEQNPMMGWRSIRRSLDEVELLRAEFEAIKKLHDKGFTNVGVMLPLVTQVEEIRKAKEILREFDLEPQENIDFGIMVETPAAVQIIKEICEEGIDFISFGTNDLTQFTLAVDRDNAKVQKLYSEKHPAVLRQIKYVIDTCKKYNVETSICGQAGSDPEMAEILVRMGIDSITANVDAVHKIRSIVSRIEKKLVLSAARKDFKI